MKRPYCIPLLAAALAGCITAPTESPVWEDPCLGQCAPSEACWSSTACIPLVACAAPFTSCPFPDGSSGCTDLRSDRYNCGACGATCLHGVCAMGQCLKIGFQCDAAGLDACHGACAYLANDPLNCGACGHRCNFGELCAGGACTAGGVACPQMTERCGQSCSDLANDPYNCGGCGTTCERGCLAGQCL
jgi:hypothetical protein